MILNKSVHMHTSPDIPRGPGLSNGKHYYRRQSDSTLGAGITRPKKGLFVVDNPTVCIVHCHMP